MAANLDENDRVEQAAAFHIAILRASGNLLLFLLNELIFRRHASSFRRGSSRAASEEDDQIAEP
ncbi:hypothetical protein ASC97_28705 [Rhizobium sp. Root1203]|jgi:DNA-binding FadR family transcriptional regulator|nr:hypothetical protein ASC97_28705 [Rhizobium sp. Root1203]